MKIVCPYTKKWWILAKHMVWKMPAFALSTHSIVKQVIINIRKNIQYKCNTIWLRFISGHHLWGYDLRSDDTPIESNLEYVCRKDATYKGSSVVQKQLKEGAKKRLITLTLKDNVAIWGLEGVYCHGKAVGYLRRADFGYFINKSIGKAFINIEDLNSIDWRNETYEIDVMGKLYPAELHLSSPLKST